MNFSPKHIFYGNKDARKNLFETMDEADKEAQTNGLNPEISEQILLEIKQKMKYGKN